MKLSRFSFALTAILITLATAQAQGRKPLASDEQSQYVVSARAGVVNIVEGDVSFERAGKSDMLIAGDVVRSGDLVKTGANGRAEILLNPGSYLRLSTNTEFIFKDTRIHRLELELLKGSAIIEASVVVETITVITPQREIPIDNGGLYRFNIGAAGGSEIVLRKGKVLAGGVVVKEGRKAMIGNGAPAITPFDKKVEDDFDLWSKERARIIVAANRKLSERALRRSSSLSMSGNAWVFNPFMGSYTFLPGFWGIVSPYGYGYSSCNPYTNWRNRNPGYTGGGGSGGGYTGGGSGSGSGGGRSNGGGSSSGGGMGQGGGRGSMPPPASPPARSGGKARNQ
ncbi:MAG TPA: FecR domain-containing protein [Blastocatellia bacterium]|nr:FecR domain-containing protein [Blastocatellia bacterium]